MILLRTEGLDPWLPLARQALEAQLTCMLERAGFAGAELEVECVDDAHMAKLNAAHMGCHGPTNILSFPSLPDVHAVEQAYAGLSPDDAAAVLFLGSLVLSVDTLEREALIYGQPVAAHCLTLLAHGVAHVLGHDHGAQMDAVCACMLG